MLLAVRSGGMLSQRELAHAIGIEGPALTHHLNRMEEGGLLHRRRNPANRRTHHVQLTATGEELLTNQLMPYRRDRCISARWAMFLNTCGEMVPSCARR